MKALIIAIAACWLLISCQNAKRVKTDEQVLTLIDSSGQTPGSPREMHARVTSLLAEQTKIKEGFTITRIDNLHPKEGYVTIIRYRLKNGDSGSFIVISENNADKVLLAHGTAPVVVKKEKKSSRVIISCSGPCACQLSVSINEETGIITVSCGCAACTPMIYYQ